MNPLLAASLPTLLTAALLVAGACTSGSAPAAPAKTAPAQAPTAASASAAPTSAAAAQAPAAAAPPPSVTLRTGTLRITADAGMYIAQDKGYLREQGLELEYVDFTTAADAIAPLGAKQLDVGVGAVGAGLFNAIGRGIDIRLVADKAATAPDPSTGFASSLALSIPKEYAETGQIRDYADLRGKTLAIPSRGTASQVLIDQALQKGGLTFNDVQLNELSFPDINTALANKGIDVGLQIEPLLTLAEGQGILVRWKPAAEIYPGQQVAAIMYGPRIAELGQDVGNRFMVAYVRGLRDYNAAFGPRHGNRAEIVDILTRNTNVKDPTLYDKMTWDYMNPDGYLNLETLARDLDWYVRNGLVTERPDVNRLVDHSFADYAVRTLGRYQP
jgi:NitT/TauT family transport system substrate-binding protein